MSQEKISLLPPRETSRKRRRSDCLLAAPFPRLPPASPPPPPPLSSATPRSLPFPPASAPLPSSHRRRRDGWGGCTQGDGQRRGGRGGGGPAGGGARPEARRGGLRPAGCRGGVSGSGGSIFKELRQRTRAVWPADGRHAVSSTSAWAGLPGALSPSPQFLQRRRRLGAAYITSMVPHTVVPSRSPFPGFPAYPSTATSQIDCVCGGLSGRQQRCPT